MTDWTNNTLPAIQADLAEHGMVAVPLEPTDAMINAGVSALDANGAEEPHVTDARDAYKAMIAVQGEG
jgi:hypothetical protein